MSFVNTDDPNYVINKSTNLVINKNEGELMSYRRQVEQFTEIKRLQSQVDNFNNEMSELKAMIGAILTKN